MVLATVLDAILLLAGGVALFRKCWPLRTVNIRYGKDSWEELYGPVFKRLLSSTTVTVITTHSAHILSAERFFFLPNSC